MALNPGLVTNARHACFTSRSHISLILADARGCANRGLRGFRGLRVIAELGGR
jgi:hypothetical protein